MLTYVAVRDGMPDPGSVALGDGEIARSGDPVAPSPPAVTLDAVAGHAVRHLAWLRSTDEVVATALAGTDELWSALDAYVPAPAGALLP
ncbi:hypothetical protein GCM10010170_011660 [Dactylosporangium salmoneum]|uniref:Uncharacterized protein n=1 Tax=Dactylosporangium salmoneum TaxID=53361 RepID=A0ABN3FKX9_9ACTN